MLEAVTGLSWVQIVLTVGIGASVFCYLLGIYSAEEFFTAEPPDAADLPKLGFTILKPLKGLDIGLHENIASLCRQDCAKLQIICGVADEADPATAVVRKLQREFPRVDLLLVVDERIYGANYKVSNLVNMYEHAKHDVIVIADSDIRVGPNYLASLDRAIRTPNAGLVTCLYRALNRGGWPTMIESLFINTDFTPLVMLARKVEKSTYAFGATIAIRREILEEVGGFRPLINTLADDYQLGYRVASKGYDLVLTNEVVDTVLALETWRGLIDHQVRWARTYRICRPAGYFGSILTHGSLWATLNVLYHGFSPISCLVSSGTLAVRYASAMNISWRHLRTETGWPAMALLPLKDLFFGVIWFMAFVSDTVVWGGHEFRVDRKGEMVDLEGSPTFSAFSELSPDSESESLQRTAQGR